MIDNVTKSQILDGLNSLKGAVSSLSVAVAGISKKLGEHDKAFEKIDARFEKIDRKLEDHDRAFEKMDTRFGKIEEKLDRHESSISHLFGLPREIMNIKMELELIKEDTAKIPELQRLLDLTAGANLVDRQERDFMNDRINGHEERLVVVEDALAITPAERVLF